MAEEMRERIRVIIHIQNFDKCSIYAREFSERELAGVRVLPACDADGGSRTLNPVELNEAVQMWLNRSRSIPGDLVTQLHIKDAEIARLKNEILRLNNIWNAHHSKCDERFSILSREHDNTVIFVKKLKDRIADLEKTAETHETATEALIKELHQKQIALADLQDLVNPRRRSCLTCGDTGCDVLIGADQTCWRPAQKEPELFICTNTKCQIFGCIHKNKHTHNDQCDRIGCTTCQTCIPYKEPAQTPAPEEGRTPIQHLQDRVLELEQHQGRADLMEKIRGLETEIFEVKRYVEQSYLERKQNADVARDVSNRQACEILKMQDQIKGLEHRLGLAQDRIAEIHPSGCVPPATSKPKSQLKTDRVKRVKP